jgi:GTP-binding protein LepA
MDTPGHVDFAYEVSRSLAACEGALLVVDASQGVEAQTLANVYQAIDNNLEIVVILNKIDLPAAEPDRIREQIEEVIGIDASNAVLISAKTGLGIPDVLEAIVTSCRRRRATADAPLKALLVDSWYDAYLGVIVLVRVIDGVLKKGQTHPHDGHRCRLRASSASATSRRRWSMSTSSAPARSASSPARSRKWPIPASATPSPTTSKPTAEGAAGLQAGAAGGVLRPVPGRCRRLRGTARRHGQAAPQRRVVLLRNGTSAALGFGFRCGFLGLLHLEIIQERLEREFNLDLIATAPSRDLQDAADRRQEIEMHNPADMPDVVKIAEIEEPWIRARS